jgi:enoyl-CoA hydratase/carnithine racemase
MNRINRATVDELQDAVATAPDETKLVTIRGSGGLFLINASND